jgi:hypothetical protein
MPQTKKARQSHDISGLRCQQRDSSVASRSSGHPTPARSLAPSPEGDESDLEEDDDDLDLLIHFDSSKTNLAYEEHPDYMELDEDEGSWLNGRGLTERIWQRWWTCLMMMIQEI